MKLNQKTFCIYATAFFIFAFSSNLLASEKLESFKNKKLELTEKIFNLQKELFKINMEIETLEKGLEKPATKTTSSPKITPTVAIPAAVAAPKAKKKKSGFKLFRSLGKPKPQIVYEYEDIELGIKKEWKGFDGRASIYLKEIVADYMENYGTVTGTLAKNGKTRIQKSDIIKFAMDGTEYFFEVTAVDSEDEILTFSIYHLIQPSE